MRQLFPLLKRFFPYLALTAVWLIIVLTNFPKPERWLIGWDNLMPELNFPLNIQRSLFAPWEEYQGLGLLGGIAHASELTRQLILLLISKIAPLNALRYIWTYTMLLIGSWGSYALSLHFLNKSSGGKTTQKEIMPALTSALFYLLNIGTVQNFYVPLESFATFYGFIAWLILYAVRYLQHKTRRDLWIFAGICLLATSAFHVQTMFVVFCLVMALFSFEFLRTKTRERMKTTFTLWLTILTINAFWLLPIGYFMISNARVTTQSKQNRIGTPETQLQNRAFGSLSNIALLKGYWFDYTDYSIETDETVPLMPEWQTHFDKPLTKTSGYLLFTLAFIGLCIQAVKKQKEGVHFYWTPLAVFFLSAIMLSGGADFLGLAFTTLGKIIPLFAQMFRTPFTKWIIVMALSVALGLGFFSAQLLSKVTQKTVVNTYFALLIIMIVWQVLPITKGTFIYDRVEITIPDPYFALFDYLKTQPKQARILYAPSPTFWGWNFYKWGYRGSGFVWYGIEQPIIDRNFDVWSTANETLYHQLNEALIAEDPELLRSLLVKYDIHSILIDESIISPKSAGTQTASDMYALIQKLNLKEQWNNDFLHLYETGIPTGFVSQYESVRAVMSDHNFVRFDPVFQTKGPYISNEAGAVVFPFVQLTKEALSNARIENNNLVISYALPQKHSGYTLELPRLDSQNTALVATMTYAGNTLDIAFPPTIQIATSTEATQLPTLEEFSIPLDEQPEELAISWNETATPLFIKKGETIQFTATNMRAGESMRVSYFDKNQATLVDNEYQVESEAYKTAIIEPSVWDAYRSQKSIPISEDEKMISLSIPLNTIPIDFVSTSATSCIVESNQVVEKEVTSHGITYKAEDGGSICDGKILTGLASRAPALLIIEGKNISGRSLKFYVENMNTKTVVLEDVLPKKSFSAYFTLLEHQNLANSPYWINFETKSFGSDVAENQLSKVELLPLSIDLKKLSQIALIPTSQENVKKGMVLHSVKKWGTAFYLVKASMSENNRLLTLHQAFDSGWVGVLKPTRLLDLFKKERYLQHMKQNGWANAWEIARADKSTQLPQEEEKTIEVIIFYWPQLLVFLGLTTTLMTLLTLKYLAKENSMITRKILRTRTISRLLGR